MKKTIMLSVFAGALVTVLGLSPVAVLAQEGDGLHVTTQVNVGVQGQTRDRGDVSEDSSTSAGFEADVQGENDNRGESATGSLHHQDSEHRNGDSLQASEEGDAEIEIDHQDAEDATTTVSAPEEVSNRGELRSFLNHMVKEDDRISDVHVSSTTVETHYEMPAKFLWTIPTNLTAQVTVASDGSVTLSYPWYAFLFAKKDEDLSSQLTQAATSTIGTSATTTFSASAQAHLLNLLFSILKNSAGN